ncbi:hypothetical protein M949_1258 [Riemerella anatipestifer CH3]|nr:hypothetical protein M949_1258 [Riemerella anatipestifer CH3]
MLLVIKKNPVFPSLFIFLVDILQENRKSNRKIEVMVTNLFIIYVFS